MLSWESRWVQWVLRRGEGQPKGKQLQRAELCPKAQCQDVPAWVVSGDGVRGAASSLSSSLTAAAGTAASLHLRKIVRML